MLGDDVSFKDFFEGVIAGGLSALAANYLVWHLPAKSASRNIAYELQRTAENSRAVSEKDIGLFVLQYYDKNKNGVLDPQELTDFAYAMARYNVELRNKFKARDYVITHPPEAPARQ